MSVLAALLKLRMFMIKKLPRVFAIDEFKGNTGKEKYQAIVLIYQY